MSDISQITNFPINNTIWFPFTVMKVWLLVAITLLIEMGLMQLILQVNGYPQNEIQFINQIVLFGNLVTGLIGYIFVKIKERLED
jgi:hypothetical protein